MYFSDCSSCYTRKDRLVQHMKSKHGIESDRSSTNGNNFCCPFKSSCEVMFRTNVELIKHCETVHEEKVGEYVR